MIPLRAEGFPNQNLYRTPLHVLERMRQLPFTRDYLVTDLGQFQRAAGHRVVRPEGYSSHILIHVGAGTGWVEIAGQRWIVNNGHSLWIPPLTPHRYGADAADPWSVSWVHFQGKGAEDLLEWTSFTPAHPIQPTAGPMELRHLYQGIFGRATHDYRRSYLLQLSRFLVDILCLLQRRPAHTTHDLLKVPMEKAMEQMEQTLSAPLQLVDYARTAGYSTAQFSRHFHTFYGTSPMQYLTERRLQRACDLLDATALSIKEIAAALGYEDAFYFSRSFKKGIGCSPLAYRLQPKG